MHLDVLISPVNDKFFELDFFFFRVLCQCVALPAHSKIKSIHHYAWPESYLFFVTEISVLNIVQGTFPCFLIVVT